jgi:hypothetical protein
MGAKMSKKSDKDGLYSSYYDVPKDSRDLIDLINHKNMNHSIGEAFCALYRLNDKDTPQRNLEKVIYYANRELERIKG